MKDVTRIGNLGSLLQAPNPLTNTRFTSDHDRVNHRCGMPPIITIDTSPSTHYIDAHHSTNQLTTLLLNDQLILVEIQGTLEYNKAKGEHDGPIKLGDISWDEPVSMPITALIVDSTGIFAHWTSQDGRTTPSSENTACSVHGLAYSNNRIHRRQGMATPHNNTKETRIRCPPRASVSRSDIVVLGRYKDTI